MKNNQKITISELIELLCEKTAVTGQQAENFIKSLFSVIEKKLLAGEQVKIGNFGTFKLQWNEPRKSVNINTGEEFIIDGFYKLAFVPEQKLKDAVNEPFAYLDPIMLDAETPETVKNDPLRNLHEQAAEIKNILSEISGMNFDNDTNKNQTSESENIDIEEDEPDVEDFFEEDEENELKTIENNIQEETVTLETDEIAEIHEAKPETENIVTENEDSILQTIENEILENNIQEETVTLETDEIAEIHEAKPETENIVTKNENDILQEVENEILENNIQEETVTQETEEIAEINETKTETENIATENKKDKLQILENKYFTNNVQKETLIQENETATDKIHKPEKNSESRKKCLWLWIVLAIALIAGGIAWLVYANMCRKNSETVKYKIYSTSKTEENTKENAVIISDSVSAEKPDSVPQSAEIRNIDSLTTAQISDNQSQNNEIAIEEVVVAAKAEAAADSIAVNEPADALDSLFNLPRTYTEFIAVDTIRRNVFLTTLALKYFGSKDFWIYIYEANSDRYTNPNAIPPNSEIKIPAVDKRLIDSTNPRCREKARTLQRKYLKR